MSSFQGVGISDSTRCSFISGIMVFSFQGVSSTVYRGVLISGGWNSSTVYRGVSFQDVGIGGFHYIYRGVLISGGSTAYRGVSISGSWNRGVPLIIRYWNLLNQGGKGLHYNE